MSNHTPAPWIIDPKYLSEVQTPDMLTIASCWHEHAVDKEITITGVLPCSLEESAANARLIASAPDLLDALSNLLHVYSEPDRRLCCDGRDCGCMGSTVHQEAEHYARKAIAKAEGSS